MKPITTAKTFLATIPSFTPDYLDIHVKFFEQLIRIIVIVRTLFSA